MKTIDVYARDGSIKGSFTVDDEDYARVKERSWYFGRGGYVRSSDLGSLSRWLTGCNDPLKYVDHIDRCVTNNCRSNLRIVTPSLNSHNRAKKDGLSSIFKGVRYVAKKGKFEVKLCGKYLGQYADEHEAARAYNYFARERFGENANLNEVPDDPEFVPASIERRNIVKEERGVSYYAQTQKWVCRVTYQGKKLHLGYHETREDALLALSSHRAKIEEVHLQKPILRNGEGVAIVPVRNGSGILECLVDDEWWHAVIKISWSLNRSGYAASPTAMHIVIMSEQRRPGLVVDHINNNRLDNRLANLRMATPSQNSQNKTISSSQRLPRGVAHVGNRFYARIMQNGEFHNLGSFLTESDAARAYDAKARALFGENAKTNTPSGSNVVTAPVLETVT